MCIFYIDSKDGQIVNVTVVDVVTAARLVPSCTYEGFFAGFTVEGEYKERFTICDSHKRNFYSQNSSMVIVLYWYKDLSSINATILLSQTECKPIIIDPCILRYSCYHYDGPCFHLKSSTDIIEFRYKRPYLTISYIKTKCVILLLESLNVITVLQSLHYSPCYVMVKLLSTQNLVSQVSFKVPPFHNIFLASISKLHEKFYEEITAHIDHESNNDTQHCTDMTCDIKNAKVNFFKVKRGNTSSSHFQDLNIYLLIGIHLEHLDTGWIDVIIKNYFSNTTNKVPISSDIVLSLSYQHSVYKRSSMEVVFLSISCPPLNSSALSRIDILLKVSESVFGK